MKKKLDLIVVLLIVSVFLWSACAPPSSLPVESTAEISAEPEGKSPGPPADETAAVAEAASGAEEVPRLQDDFYTHINAEWISGADLETEGPRAMRMNEIQQAAYERLGNDIMGWLEPGDAPDDPALQNLLIMAAMLMDVEKRTEDGAEPLRPYLEAVDEIENLDDLNGMLTELVLNGDYVPFRIVIQPDTFMPEDNCMVMTSPRPNLPDKSYYEVGAGMLDDYVKRTASLARAAGMDEQGAAALAEDAAAFDKLVAPYMLTVEETLQTQSSDTHVPFEEFTGYCKNIDFATLIEGWMQKAPETVEVWNPAYYKDLDSLVNEDNLELVKNWIKAKYLNNSVLFLSPEYATALDPTHEPGNGMDEEEIKELAAQTIRQLFVPELSSYYTQTYLGEETIADLEEMFENEIAEYKTRMQNNEWLGEETKKKAIEKLDKMFLLVGDPGYTNPMTEGITLKTFEEGGAILDNAFMMRRNGTQLAWTRFYEKNEGIERMGDTPLQMPAYLMNAMYMAEVNGVYVSAAILDDPYYHKDSPDSENLGGIGAVIAHEISHGFDQQGAKYDAEGNLNDWWTAEDHEEFEKRTQKMVDLFDGLPYRGGEVNGRQTVVENTADAGGLGVALSLLEREDNPDYKGFFESWAEVWASLETEDKAQELLKIDTHAPGLYRVNRQLMNIEQFYDTFQIQEGDGMYLAPAGRVSIW